MSSNLNILEGERLAEVVNDKTILEVGKMYNVRCARMSDGITEYFMPVIGDAHTDKQLGFPDKHFHIDGRFVGKMESIHIEIDDSGRTNSVCSFDPSPCVYTIKEIVIKKRRCKRLTTGINPPSRKILGDKSKYWNWYDSMVGKSCKGKKCPHLGTTMVEENGRLVCQLHNLQGCIKTEVIIPDLTQPNF